MPKASLGREHENESVGVEHLKSCEGSAPTAVC